jgi:hypothetical protein
MRCPTLKELPVPPKEKTGWPWTEESKPLPDHMPDGHAWPRITVITPSFNQGQFLEETIRSIVLQGYPNLEYFIFDGASTDNSVEVIKKYAPWLTYWVSEPDSGQSDAISRGLSRGTGQVATWINSDDLLCKEAFVTHASREGFDGNVIYAGKCIYIDAESRPVRTQQGRIHSLEDLLRIKTIWRAGGHFVQPETLFPLKLALEVGGINKSLHDAMDYEFWGKLLLAGARIEYTDIPFGMLRIHDLQKTANGLRTTRAMLDVATDLIPRAELLSDNVKSQILEELESYWIEYQEQSWKASGRLARIGLPVSFVRQIREIGKKISLKSWKAISRRL